MPYHLRLSLPEDLFPLGRPTPSLKTVKIKFCPFPSLEPRDRKAFTEKPVANNGSGASKRRPYQSRMFMEMQILLRFKEATCLLKTAIVIVLRENIT